MKIAIVAAIGINGELGKDGKLPWNISEDLKFFKQLTVGNTVVMGRKTYESLPIRLKDRQIIILTTQDNYEPLYDTETLVMHTLAEVIEYAYKADLDNLYIAGGGEMYKHFMPLASQLYLTRVEESFEADVYFPYIVYSDWNLKTIRYSSNDNHTYRFEYYDR